MQINKVASATSIVTVIDNPQQLGIVNFEESIEPSCTNIQLAFWNDAKQKYSDFIKGYSNPDLSYMILIVVSLSNSLTFLYGVNYEKDQNKTPELIDMVKNQKMHRERPDLFRNLNSLFLFYRNFLKHPDNKKVNEIAALLTKEKVIEYMETTRNVWKWFIDKFFTKNNNYVPADQLTEFKEINY